MSDIPLKTIEESNAEFLALSQKEQRIAIARDVIKQVNLQRYIAQCGTYFDLSLSETALSDIEAVCAIGDLQRLMALDAAACTVCGLGACFASAVRLSNDVVAESRDIFHDVALLEVELNSGNSKFDDKLDQFFDQKQIGMIECAFEISLDFDRVPLTFDDDEGDADGNDDPEVNSWVRDARDFGETYDDPTHRLIAIMENVIANDGTFVP